MDLNAAATSNWSLIAGSSIAGVVQVKLSTTDEFTKPPLEDILAIERAILLQRTSDYQSACEFTIQIFPKYRMSLVTLVCTCPKIEVFSGEQCEYTETIYGESMDCEDDDADIEGYRYDMEICKSTLSQLMLKMFTQSDELCIYGVHVIVTPSPNALPGLPLSINLDNVKKMLNLSKTPGENLSAKVKKYNSFLESFVAMGISDHKFEKCGSSKSPTAESSVADASIKQYIDTKIQETESRILKKLETVQEAQDRKLDRILTLLEGGSMKTEASTSSCNGDFS